MSGKLCELPYSSILHVLQVFLDSLDGSDENACPVVIKRAPRHLLSIEREILKIVQGHTCIRQMIDNIEDPPSLVLEYLDDNMLDVCSRKRLEGPGLKLVARTVLEALAALHENGFVHTGSWI